MTVAVEEVGGIITKAAPIIWKFRGQPLDNLLKWLVKQGDLHHERL